MSMKETKLIAMLTWNDVTVANAKEVFLEAKDAPADLWGFKLECIPSNEKLLELVGCMKDAGKEVFLEVLAIDEETGLRSAETAVKAGIDHLIGTGYHDSIAGVIAGSAVKYAPFVGLDPKDTRLRGTVQDIAADARRVEKLKAVHGINLSGFRYVSGEPVEVITAVAEAIQKPLSIAGSVNTFERIDILKKIPNVWAFTIGGAFFEKKFGNTFGDQIRVVHDYLNR
jgi:uncharacterized protein related to proFAR isomerase